MIAFPESLGRITSLILCSFVFQVEEVRLAHERTDIKAPAWQLASDPVCNDTGVCMYLQADHTHMQSY